jgi:1,4-dihydroxy-2-naphthoyl-CoA hydrolase
MSHSFDYRFQVRLHDADAAGVMFFAHLLRHAHDAYEAFMAAQGLSLASLIEQGTHLPLAHCEADFLAPMRHGMDFRILLKAARIGQTSFVLNYAFHAQQGALMATAQTVHVAMAPETGEKTPLPPALRDALQRLL